MSALMEDIKLRAKMLNKTIVLAEGEDIRVITAASKIVREGIASIILLGNQEKIEEKGKNIDLTGIKIIDPQSDGMLDTYSELLYNLRKNKGMSEDGAKQLAKNPLYYGVLMIKNGDADGMVAGAINATGDVLRPALQIIKMAPNITSVSSSFIMVLPENSVYGENGIMVMGDCAVNIEPDENQLAAIAIASAETAKNIAGISPKVAMLSFSTKCSARHKKVDMVANATEIVKNLCPDLLIDGELQADAALVPEVGLLKSPDSKVAGRANVLVFPSLESGNIGYKLTQRLGNADAIGPIIQGLAKPVNDLSRGCSYKDIIDVVAITALQSAIIR